MRTILAIVPHFPSPTARQDGQAIYLSQVVEAAARVAEIQVRVVALRIGNQTAVESGEGWSVERIQPKSPLETVFELYEPAHLMRALSTLHHAATAIASELGVGTPVWCHGYETGDVLKTLVQRGHHGVGVLHYSVGVETLHDLALGDDPVRAAAFDSPIATRLGRMWPTAARPLGVRWASRLAAIGQSLPGPSALTTQFAKLSLERALVAHASTLIAVGPSFEAEVNRLYPCTIGRSRHVIAGAPAILPTPAWPAKKSNDRMRVVMVGRPTGQKGWDYVAAALSAMRPALAQKIEIVLIGGLGEGNGPYSSYSMRVAAAFSSLHHPTVYNIGELTHTAVLAHLAAADLLLFPSVFEPLGLVVLEAMAAQCCVLASNAAGPADLVKPPWGRLMEFSDPSTRVAAIVAGLEAVLALDPDAIKSHQLSAATAATAYTWDHCAAVHLDALLGR